MQIRSCAVVDPRGCAQSFPNELVKRSTILTGVAFLAEGSHETPLVGDPSES